MRDTLAVALAALLMACASPLAAQDGQDDDVGWADLPAVIGPNAQATQPPPATAAPARKRSVALSMVGLFSEDLGVAPERLRPWVLGRSTVELAGELRWSILMLHLGLHAEVDVAYLVDTDKLDRPTRDSYAHRLLPWENYLALRGPELALTVGRQIVAWGDSQLLHALDLPNPRDQRMPGLGEPAGQRIPLTMTRLTLDHGAHRLELMATHEVDYSFQPPPFGVYSPLPHILASGQGVRESGFLQVLAGRDVSYDHEPARFSLASQQLLARYRYVGSLVELGLHAGYLPHAEGALRLPVLSGGPADPVKFPVEHPHYTALGASLLGARADFVGFADTLLELGRPITVGDLDALAPEVQIARQSWARYVVGLRYAGFDNGFIALEHGFGFRVDRAQERGFEPLLPVAPPAIAGMYQQSFAHDQLEAQLTASVFGPELRGGGVARARVSVRPRDGLRFTLAYVLFLPGERASPIAGFTRHDRVDLGVRWDFSVATP